eukprot:COSAG05_NODE_886_length_6751_cov_151.638906_19_plen_65_part_00
MMYGVPNMKCDKEDIVLRRVKLMEDEVRTQHLSHSQSTQHLHKTCMRAILNIGTLPRVARVHRE